MYHYWSCCRGIGIEKFYVPDSEKVALRPSYEKYRYEEASSPWDDYDDEYDDTMDDRQTYNVDARFVIYS